MCDAWIAMNTATGTLPGVLATPGISVLLRPGNRMTSPATARANRSSTASAGPCVTVPGKLPTPRNRPVAHPLPDVPPGARSAAGATVRPAGQPEPALRPVVPSPPGLIWAALRGPNRSNRNGLASTSRRNSPHSRNRSLRSTAHRRRSNPPATGRARPFHRAGPDRARPGRPGGVANRVASGPSWVCWRSSSWPFWCSRSGRMPS